MSLTGMAGGPPLRMGVSISDHVAGIYAVTGILAALHERAQTGKGRRIEVPLSTMISLLSYEAALYLYSGEVPGPVGSGHRSLMPYNAVGTRDGHIVIDAHLPKFCSALCGALQIEAIENDRVHTLEVRNRNRDELLKILNEIFPAKTSREWPEILDAKGVPCAPINDLKSALKSDHPSVEDGRRYEHEGVGLTFQAVGNPIRMQDAGETQYSSPPLLGEHTEVVLREVAGYSDDKIGLLLRDEVIARKSEAQL